MRQPNRKTDHKWRKLTPTQSSCTTCGVLKTVTHVHKTGENKITYKDNNSVVHTEYIPCIEKYDDSEFYK
jgi:hypothetical protein